MPVRVLAASPFVMQTSLGLFALTFGPWGAGYGAAPAGMSADRP
jgi:hypothetical protein